MEFLWILIPLYPIEIKITVKAIVWNFLLAEALNIVKHDNVLDLEL